MPHHVTLPIVCTGAADVNRSPFKLAIRQRQSRLQGPHRGITNALPACPTLNHEAPLVCLPWWTQIAILDLYRTPL